MVFCHFGETFSSGERGEGDDGSPKVGEVATADEISDSFEEPLAETGKAVYIDRWVSPVDSIFLSEIFRQRIIAKCPLFMQEQPKK